MGCVSASLKNLGQDIDDGGRPPGVDSSYARKVASSYGWGTLRQQVGEPKPWLIR